MEIAAILAENFGKVKERFARIDYIGFSLDPSLSGRMQRIGNIFENQHTMLL